MARHRLFAAFRPPAATRALLARLMDSVPGARWQDDTQLHCTLRFIGEVDRHQAEDVVAALGAVRSPALALALGPAGAFERKGRIDTLWIGVEPREIVAALHGRIDGALRRVGVAPDGRAFVPHVTIARFNRGNAPGPEAPALVPSPIGHHFQVRHFELIESRLGADGATYETIARYPLG